MNQQTRFRNAMALAGLLLVMWPRPADAACAAIPYVFSNSVSIVDATTTNANNTALRNCAVSVDNTQIGISGIWLSQVIPDTSAHATLGGTQTVILPNGLTVNNLTSSPGLTVNGSTAATAAPFNVNGNLVSQPLVKFNAPNLQATDIFQVFLNAVKKVWIDSTGALQLATPLTAANGGTGKGTALVGNVDMVIATNLSFTNGGGGSIGGLNGAYFNNLATTSILTARAVWVACPVSGAITQIKATAAINVLDSTGVTVTLVALNTTASVTGTATAVFLLNGGVGTPISASGPWIVQGSIQGSIGSGTMTPCTVGLSMTYAP